MTIAWIRQRSAGPQPADLLFAAAWAGIAQAEIWVFTLADDRPLWLRAAASVLTLVASGALAFRRVRPVASYWVNTAAVWAVIAVGFPGDFYQYTNVFALYTVASRGSARVAWLALPASLGGVAFYFLRFPGGEGTLVLWAFVTAVWVAAWLGGRMYGSRLEQSRLRAERDLARRLADANEERLALEEERSRIARELHDIIGHTVSVMVVHAGAGRRAAGSDPDTVRRAFDTIEQTGRAALSELDRVLAVLRRDDSAQEHPIPGLADLKTLAETFTDTGLRVDAQVTGDPAAVPASVGLAAYRIAQEALTNTLRHATATTATVQITIDPRRLVLTIADNGAGDPSTLQPGRGIRGMRERAALHGGTVTLDRTAASDSDGTGGLAVTAHLTWEPPA